LNLPPKTCGQEFPELNCKKTFFQIDGKAIGGQVIKNASK
jgi:hypothetical protein